MANAAMLAAVCAGCAPMVAEYRAFEAHKRGDDPTAIQRFRSAAEQGCASAQYKLGVMYAEGLGAPQDDAEAVKRYRRAAE
jgi:hypothetical protein